MVEIKVSDTGEGMTDEALAKVFEPFYTTKEKGTGMGLPVCRAIVENQGGELAMGSAAGEGTTVYIRLPLGAGEENREIGNSPITNENLGQPA